MAEIMNGASADATAQGTVNTHATTPDGVAVVNSEGKINKPAMNKATTSEKLAKIGWSNAPVDTFLRHIGKGKTKSDTFNFFSVTARGLACKVSEDATITDGSFVIKMVEGSGTHNLSVGGQLMADTIPVVNKAAGAAGAKAALRPLILRINKIDYAKDEVTVQGVNATSGTIPAETILYRVGIACDQHVAKTEDPQAMPTKDYNYCQRMLCTISENVYQAMQEKEVEYGMNDFKDQALIDFRLQSEAKTIFGGNAVAGEDFIDKATGRRVLNSRGILDFDIQAIEKGENEEIDTYLNRVMQEMFSVNNGSSERLLIYGAGFGSALANSKWWNKQLEANKTEIKWGVTWKVIESNFGTLRGVMDPALSLYGSYSNCALVIDPAHIRLIEQVPLHERKLDLLSAGVSNTHDVVLEESTTLELTNPKAHGLLQL